MDRFLKERTLGTDKPVVQKAESVAIEVVQPHDLAKIRETDSGGNLCAGPIAPGIMDVMPSELVFSVVQPKTRTMGFSVFNGFNRELRLTLIGLSATDAKPSDRKVNCYIGGLWPMIYNNQKERSINAGERVYWRLPDDDEQCAVMGRPHDRRTAVLTPTSPERWAPHHRQYALMAVGSSQEAFDGASALEQFRLVLLMEHHFLVGTTYRSAGFGSWCEIIRA